MNNKQHLGAAAFTVVALCNNIACAKNNDASASNQAPTLISSTRSQAQTTPNAIDDATQNEIVDRVRFFPRAGFANRMIGGEIQGSNLDATSGFVTLAKIKSAPKEGVWSIINFKNTKRYRFVRYFAPPGSYANIAELQFYNSSTRINGVPYGTFGSLNNSGNDFNKAFDGDVKTFFDAPDANAQYLGIEIKSADDATPSTPIAAGKGLRHYHIGNSLTDTIGEYTQQIAISAGYKGDWFDRQTIPGAPLYLNYSSDGGFGTNHKTAFNTEAPLSDLVMQVFIGNGDSDSAEFSLKFYDEARVKSPDVRPWIYGQWPATGTGSSQSGSPFWEAMTMAYMRTYMAHAMNFNAQTKGKKTEVIPGGLALINLKKAFDAGKVPGMTNFFASNFEDDLHVNMNARYFIGLVTFSCLYNQNPVGLPVVKINDNPPKLNAEQNKIYQQIAWDTVQSFKKDKGASLAFAVPGDIDARAALGQNVPPSGPIVRYISAKSSFSYVLSAPQNGVYEMKASLGSNNANRVLEVFVNNQKAGQVLSAALPNGVSDTTALKINLQKGANLLRLFVPDDRPFDINSVKVYLPNQPLKNTLPQVSFREDYIDTKGGETFTENFRVDDAQTPENDIKTTVSADNAKLISSVKVENISFKDQWNNVFNRKLTVQSVAGQTGTAYITITATDGNGSSRTQTVKFNVK